jgi:hypothetical protein
MAKNGRHDLSVTRFDVLEWTWNGRVGNFV